MQVLPGQSIECALGFSQLSRARPVGEKIFELLWAQLVVDFDEIDGQREFAEVPFVQILGFPDDTYQSFVFAIPIAIGRTRSVPGRGKRPCLTISQGDLSSRPKAGTSVKEFVYHSPRTSPRAMIPIIRC
jgi:hypothetical protein